MIILKLILLHFSHCFFLFSVILFFWFFVFSDQMILWFYCLHNNNDNFSDCFFDKIFYFFFNSWGHFNDFHCFGSNIDNNFNCYSSNNDSNVGLNFNLCFFFFWDRKLTIYFCYLINASFFTIYILFVVFNLNWIIKWINSNIVNSIIQVSKYFFFF